MEKANEEQKTDEMTCIWPECGQKGTMMMTLQAMKPNENKMPVRIEGKGVKVSMCTEHFGLAPFCAIVHDTDGTDKLFGPTQEVKLMQVVIAGMVFSGQLQKLIKARDEAYKTIEKSEANQNEPETKNAEQTDDKPIPCVCDKQCDKVQQGESGEPKPQDN